MYIMGIAGAMEGAIGIIIGAIGIIGDIGDIIIGDVLMPIIMGDALMSIIMGEPCRSFLAGWTVSARLPTAKLVKRTATQRAPIVIFISRFAVE